MQRTMPGERKGYAGRRLAARKRNVAGPPTCRPAQLPTTRIYGLRMRNVEPPDRSAWAALVKQCRGVTGMTGAELSRRLDVDRATIWRWETGRQRPENVAVVEAFARLFAIDIEEALAAAGMRPQPAPHRAEPLRPALDPALAEAQAMLDDPNVSDVVKAQVHAMLAAMVEMARQQPQAPRRRRAG